MSEKTVDTKIEEEKTVDSKIEETKVPEEEKEEESPPPLFEEEVKITKEEMVRMDVLKNYIRQEMEKERTVIFQDEDDDPSEEEEGEEREYVELSDCDDYPSYTSSTRYPYGDPHKTPPKMKGRQKAERYETRRGRSEYSSPYPPPPPKPIRKSRTSSSLNFNPTHHSRGELPKYTYIGKKIDFV